MRLHLKNVKAKLALMDQTFLLFLDSTAFKETEQRYSEWEKVPLSLLQAVIHLEQLRDNLSGPTLLRLAVFHLSRNVTGNCASTFH